MTDKPRLRMLEAFPVAQNGQQLIALRDPAGFTEQVLVLPTALLDLVSLFDGEHSVSQIQDILRGRHGDAPTALQIERLVTSLDDAGFLEGERFEARRRAIEEGWARNPLRPAVHAGGAYESDASALSLQIEGFFRDPDGPGPLADRPAASTEPALRGLIAPHIDFHRGGPLYAWAYRELLARSDADLFVILGTCHAGMADPFAVTLKAYDTPLGAASVDLDFYEDLRRRYGDDLLGSEAAHRNEHSIEFQTVMLRHLLGRHRAFSIVPVLASYLHEAVWSRGDPERDPRVPRFLDALLGAMAASRRRICVIAGVDLAHVGPRFGDRELNTPQSLEAVATADLAMLEAVTGGDATAFYAAVVHDRDRRRICGLSPIYTFLRALPGVHGRLLRYRQWPDPEGAVSFCAAAFP
ncbi:MAG: AmmeMemoRadiSam system protein B [Candidatus Rokuibacteriota bacterium]|nr:MAG: AmmeMemoRadiSam system protein B [Candidatus Rokubacteria bacterium]